MSGANEPVLGDICHVELPAPDLRAMQEFYGGVFGWTFKPMGETYVLFAAGTSGGGLDADAAVVDGGVCLVLAVDEVTAKLEEIRAAGGTVLCEKTAISDEHGFYAYFRDPCGNRMGVWSRT